jgi:hypothetical protein
MVATVKGEVDREEAMEWEEEALVQEEEEAILLEEDSLLEEHLLEAQLEERPSFFAQYLVSYTCLGDALLAMDVAFCMLMACVILIISTIIRVEIKVLTLRRVPLLTLVLMDID